MMLCNMMLLGNCPVADDGGTRPSISPAQYFLFWPQLRDFSFGEISFPSIVVGLSIKLPVCDGHIKVASQILFLLSRHEISGMDLFQGACRYDSVTQIPNGPGSCPAA